MIPKGKPPGLIRVSELPEFVYCEQAWWFRLQGYVPHNRERLQAGWSYHREHARRVHGWWLGRRLAWGLLLLAGLLTGLALYLSWMR